MTDLPSAPGNMASHDICAPCYLLRVSLRPDAIQNTNLDLLYSDFYVNENKRGWNLLPTRAFCQYTTRPHLF